MATPHASNVNIFCSIKNLFTLFFIYIMPKIKFRNPFYNLTKMFTEVREKIDGIPTDIPPTILPIEGDPDNAVRISCKGRTSLVNGKTKVSNCKVQIVRKPGANKNENNEDD